MSEFQIGMIYGVVAFAVSQYLGEKTAAMMRRMIEKR